MIVRQHDVSVRPRSRPNQFGKNGLFIWQWFNAHVVGRKIVTIKSGIYMNGVWLKKGKFKEVS